MEDLLRVGVIANTHGVHGEVKVYPTTDDINRFDYLEDVILDKNGELVDLHVTGVKYFKNMVILCFEEFDNLNQVEGLKGLDLLVTRENAIPLKEGECFVADLIGCKVITDENEELGILKDVLKTAANDVYVVKMANNKEVLIPVIEQCVLEKDIENKIVRVHLLKGLID